MSIHLTFTPSAAFVLEGSIDLEGVKVSFVSMSVDSAVIEDLSMSELEQVLPALSGILGVSVSAEFSGGSQTFTPLDEAGLDQGDKYEDEDALDNVFELDFGLSVSTPAEPGLTKAEVIRLKPVAEDKISLWESLFCKPPPVLDRLAWFNTKEADYYIYSPNDLSKPENHREDCTKNTELTYLMLQVYKKVCVVRGVNPSITLQSGDGPFPVLELDTLSGLQPSAIDERAARLANSSIDIDDSYLIQDFLTFLKLMSTEELESHSAHLELLVKAETILTGSSTRVTNHTVVRKLCSLAEASFATHGSFMEGDTQIMNALIFTLRQMVLEDKLLESSRDYFIACMVRAGLKPILDEVLKLFDSACGK